ncbi:hypothetical protein Tco_1533033 [Tanacetum coccineum]
MACQKGGIYVARILNMVSTKKVDKTPYELRYGKVPNLSYLKIWGCEAIVKRDTPNKLQQISVKSIFIGYPKKTMGYYFYFPSKNKIVVARKKMDNPNLTMEEYIRLEEERAQRRGETFDWQNAKFGRTKHYYVDECFANFEAEFPAIVLEQP